MCFLNSVDAAGLISRSFLEELVAASVKGRG